MLFCEKTGKIGYEIRSDAVKSLNGLSNRTNAKARTNLHPFKCETCRLWHLGRLGNRKAPQVKGRQKRYDVTDHFCGN